MCALTELADAELRCGRRDEALATALRALDLARMQLLEVRSPHVALGWSLSACFAEEDPRCWTPSSPRPRRCWPALATPCRWSGEGSSGAPAAQWAACARAGGIGARGGRRRVARFGGRPGGVLVRARRTRVRGGADSEALSHFAVAADAAAGARRPGLALDAEHQRARVLAAVGRVDEAASALADVERRWDTCGHEALAALALAELAAVLARSSHDGDPRPGGGNDDGARSAGEARAVSGSDHGARSHGDHGARSDALIGVASARLAGASLELRVRLLVARAEHATARGTGVGRRGVPGGGGRFESPPWERRRCRWSRTPRRSRRATRSSAAKVRAADRDNAEAVRCLLAGEATALDWPATTSVRR